MPAVKPYAPIVALLASTWLVAACSGESTPGASGAGAGGDSAGGSGGKGGAGGSTGGSGGSSGGSGGSSGSGSGGVTFANAPTELATAICAKAFECCTEAELEALAVVGTSEAQCRLAVATLLQLYAVDIQESLDAGRAEYDGEAVAGCIAAQEGRSCDDLPSFGEIGCAGAVVPLVEMGETCGAHHECIDGYCDGATQASTPTGTCAAPKPEGEACTIPEECEGGACNTDTGCTTSDEAPICGG
jgi:hypothetical protein